jgi:hypothetical protein
MLVVTRLNVGPSVPLNPRPKPQLLLLAFYSLRLNEPALLQFSHGAESRQVDLSPTHHVDVSFRRYDGSMKNKAAEKATKQVRIYPKEYGILRRLAFRKNTTIAVIIRQLVA